MKTNLKRSIVWGSILLVYVAIFVLCLFGGKAHLVIVDPGPAPEATVQSSRSIFSSVAASIEYQVFIGQEKVKAEPGFPARIQTIGPDQTISVVRIEDGKQTEKSGTFSMEYDQEMFRIDLVRFMDAPEGDRSSWLSKFKVGE